MELDIQIAMNRNNSATPIHGYRIGIVSHWVSIETMHTGAACCTLNKARMAMMHEIEPEC